MWLATALGVCSLFTILLGIAVTGPTGRACLALFQRQLWGKYMLVGVFACVGMLCGLLGSWWAMAEYERSVENERTRQQGEQRRAIDLTNTRAELAATHRQLTETHSALSVANQRADRLEERRRRYLVKLESVMRQTAALLDEADGFRYRLDEAANKGMADLDRAYQQTYERAIETWRGRVATMLDAEMPSLRLGQQFSAIDGRRGSGVTPTIWGVTRLHNCIAELRSIHRALPAYVEQTVQ